MPPEVPAGAGQVRCATVCSPLLSSPRFLGLVSPLEGPSSDQLHCPPHGPATQYYMGDGDGDEDECGAAAG